MKMDKFSCDKVSRDWNEKGTQLSLADFHISAYTHIGFVRKTNQDRYVINPLADGSVLLGIADGLGGEVAGDLAAEMIRIKLAAVIHIPAGEEKQYLLRLSEDLDQEIMHKSETNQNLGGMGSTLIAVLIRDQFVYWVHIGDSRLYLFRNGQLIQITEDQTFTRFLVKEGKLTQEEVPFHYSGCVMDQYIGCGYCEPESESFEIARKDLLLLTTDGFHNQIKKEELVASLHFISGDQIKIKDLVTAVLKNGGGDNLTAVIADYKK